MHSERIDGRRPASALRLSLAGLAVSLLALSCQPARAGAEPAAGVPDKTFDHSAYTALLEKYLDDKGLVDYKGWKRKDLPALEKYLGEISKTDPAKLASREERIAFWINTYNALTIKGIIEFYPLESIKDKVARVFGYNIWDDYKITIRGEEYSLNRIEHKILRPMGEPRVHFALVCASTSCPELRREAFRGKDLDAQLADQAKRFLNDPSRNRIDLSKGKAHLSRIFQWFDEDFGGSKKKVLQYIAPYRPEGERAKLKEGKLSVDYLDYDWGLNEQKK